MSAEILYRDTSYGETLYGYEPGFGADYPTSHAIFFNNTSITLTWGSVSWANSYQLQVSLVPDFSTTILSTLVTTGHTHTFTDSGTNDRRRYWRWRPSADAGSTYDAWSEVGSYWLNTTGLENVSIPLNTWCLINPSLVTDRYTFEMFPIYTVTQNHIFRTRSRNRLGAMLSEYVTLKGRINFSFDQNRWISIEEFSEIRRFHESVKTFYLALFRDGGIELPVPNIWKVQLETDPSFSMLAAGRQDLMIGSLTFEEV